MQEGQLKLWWPLEFEGRWSFGGVGPSYLPGPPRLGTPFSGAGPWGLSLSHYGAFGGGAVWGTVVHGSVCMFGFGKLLTGRFLPQNPHSL